MRRRGDDPQTVLIWPVQPTKKERLLYFADKLIDDARGTNQNAIGKYIMLVQLRQKPRVKKIGRWQAP